MTAVTAAEYKANAGHDFTLADAFNAVYLDVEAAGAEVEDVGLMTVSERQVLNARMADWYGIG
jgi:hypothetical protein